MPNIDVLSIPTQKYMQSQFNYILNINWTLSPPEIRQRRGGYKAFIYALFSIYFGGHSVLAVSWRAPYMDLKIIENLYPSPGPSAIYASPRHQKKYGGNRTTGTGGCQVAHRLSRKPQRCSCTYIYIYTYKPYVLTSKIGIYDTH